MRKCTHHSIKKVTLYFLKQAVALVTRSSFIETSNGTGAHRAAIWRGIKQYGVEPYDKNLYLWGFIFTPLLKTKVRILDFLQNRFRIFNFTDTKILTRLKHVKGVIFISGYSSVINKLSEMVVKNGIVFDDLKMIKGTF